MPNENTIPHFRIQLTERATLHPLMQVFEQQLRKARYLVTGGKIVDATLVPAAKRRDTHKKATMKASKSAKQL